MEPLKKHHVFAKRSSFFRQTMERVRRVHQVLIAVLVTGSSSLSSSPILDFGDPIQPA